MLPQQQDRLQMADSNLIGHVLNDFLIYNLRTETKPPTTVTTNDTMGQTMSYTTRMVTSPANNTVPNTNDSDSLSNLTLSHRTWFTTTTTQIDAIVSRQNKLKQQTSSQLTTIMAQLETICTLMEEQQQWQDQYNNYEGYDQDRPFSPAQSHMEEETEDQQIKMHTNLWAAGDSTMEDTSMTK